MQRRKGVVTMSEDLERVEDSVSMMTEDVTDRLGRDIQDLDCGRDEKVDINANEREEMKNVEEVVEEVENELRLDTVPIEVKYVRMEILNGKDE